MAIIMNEIDEKKDSLLKMDLQFFAQGDNPGDDKPGHDVHDGDNGGVNPGAEPEPYAGEGDDKTNKKPNKKEKYFTQDEVNRIVKDRLARALKDKEEAIKEAEKLAKMNAEQKREYELEKAQRENEELKAKLNRYELGKEATAMLSESGIVANDEILDFVVREDAEQTKTAVEAFSKLVKDLTEQMVKEKLKGNSPTKQNTQTATMSKEEIMSIRDTEKRQRLIKENIHLFQN